MHLSPALVSLPFFAIPIFSAPIPSPRPTADGFARRQLNAADCPDGGDTTDILGVGLGLGLGLIGAGDGATGLTGGETDILAGLGTTLITSGGNSRCSACSEEDNTFQRGNNNAARPQGAPTFIDAPQNVPTVQELPPVPPVEAKPVEIPALTPQNNDAKAQALNNASDAAFQPPPVQVAAAPIPAPPAPAPAAIPEPVPIVYSGGNGGNAYTGNAGDASGGNSGDDGSGFRGAGVTHAARPGDGSRASDSTSDSGSGSLINIANIANGNGDILSHLIAAPGNSIDAPTAAAAGLLPQGLSRSGDAFAGDGGSLIFG